ncbi:MULTISPECIES: hypothetical protein [unclassified Breznakia]|uniref:hypothetical protein n=1 Tax=unclassified Breznakia TaxID=2623764 RepID=UPI00247406ED|nr:MULTISPECIES: hypothetical protein [unclassified Breznakia]MDH6366847.1 ABC-type lipoprotein export system ATPase subunit [Breznakia sp. PH1-1]MDH6404025.1 ABC-type lipoprotein export system ATPase subunit [Breznakia sp. PF1-11]MDH6411753.1 ABC-type lipoprotein export system ATPase subunit [Breznakia sp. PFB1-11]MDH6414013.1 ABC-type lipoprotein export system ATPase subunit [Breznakia sp. PFB1-14]MDH6416443.1 ABC-type lipoprotein export system ATPase subunit [Breznakia sp. PFB1-4]
MHIKIETYRNIKKLDMDLVDDKINFVFGLSGTGKSSINKAIHKEDLEFNKMIGVNSDTKILIDGKDPSIYNIEQFDFSCENKYIFPTSNDSIFDILIDDDNEYQQIQIDFDTLIINIKDEIERINDLVGCYKKLAKELGGTKLKTSTYELKATAKINKLTIDISKKSNSAFAYLQSNTDEKNQWLLDGIDLIENEECPFCDKKLSKTKQRKLNRIKEVDNKSFKVLRLNEADINAVTSSPIPTTTSGIKNLSNTIRDIMVALLVFDEFSNAIARLSNQNEDLIHSKLTKIKINKEFNNYFPMLVPYVNEYNKKLNMLINEAYKARKKTNKLLSKKTKKINNLINQCNIPYKIQAKYSKSEITEYKLVHHNDIEEKDRKESLSDGEKNTISFILFLLDCEKKETDLIFIDDPISAMDHYRRSILTEYIFNILKNKTVVVMSHDSVFAKYAVNSRHNNVGVIKYLKNENGIVDLIDIEKKDFNKFDDFLVERIKKSDDYYQQIINLRMLYEGRNASIIYSYLSCILHITTSEELHRLIDEKNTDENTIVKRINENHKINLKTFEESIYDQIDIDNYSVLEKAVLLREANKMNLTKVKSKERAEINYMLHLNDRLVVCLNPHEYEFCSDNLREALERFSNEFANRITN